MVLTLLSPSPVSGEEPVRESFRVVNRKTLAADTIECERIVLGDPDDYKPDFVMLPMAS
jgi:hypothetical protein